MKSQFSTDYFELAPQARKQKLLALHNIILDLYPNAQISMDYKMPTYRVGDGWVAIANQKNYVSLYTCGEAHLQQFKAKHPNYKTGKGCINFRPKDELPTEDLKHVITHAIEHPK